jgi:HD-GYP domain-containing protein (c-di-GMP phosphodiesterase class II)
MKRVRPDRKESPLEATTSSYIRRIAAEKDMDRLMLLLADFGRYLIDADRCTVWVCDENDGTLQAKLAHGIDRVAIPKTKGLPGWVATHGAPLLINDPYHDDRFDQDADMRTGYLTRSVLALPFKDADGRTIAVIQAVNKLTGDGTFSEADREHLMLVASYAGVALETARMENEIEAVEREVIRTMAEAVSVRSAEIGTHGRRVAVLSRLLGELAGMSAEDVETLALAAPLHDIGLIGIPDSVLLKPAALDGAEWATIQSHTTLGHDILKQAPEGRLMGTAAIIAWQHHERWSGGGYPCGLEGERIHRYARVTAITEVFDALASDRPWRKAWELDPIVKLFQDDRGVQFDPDLDRIFLENIDAFVAVRLTPPVEPAPPWPFSSSTA